MNTNTNTNTNTNDSMRLVRSSLWLALKALVFLLLMNHGKSFFVYQNF